jgi:hypothetical protein
MGPATAEGQVRVGSSADVEAVGIGESGFVAVGRRKNIAARSPDFTGIPRNSVSLVAVRTNTVTDWYSAASAR